MTTTTTVAALTERIYLKHTCPNTLLPLEGSKAALCITHKAQTPQISIHRSMISELCSNHILGDNSAIRMNYCTHISMDESQGEMPKESPNMDTRTHFAYNAILFRCWSRQATLHHSDRHSTGKEADCKGIQKWSVS